LRKTAFLAKLGAIYGGPANKKANGWIVSAQCASS